VTLSIPIPEATDVAAAAVGGQDKLIDFAQFDEVRWREEEEDLRQAKMKGSVDKPRMPPAQLTMKYQLTDSELLIFGTSDKVDGKTVRLGGDSTVEHPATFAWNILSRLHVVFKGESKNPFNPAVSALSLDNWCLTYDRLLLKAVRNVSGGIVVVSAAAVDVDLLYEASPTSQEIYKEVGPKRLLEREIIDTVMAEGWPSSVLQLPNRAKLSRSLLEQLKIIEIQGGHRLELLTFPETRLMQIYIPADFEKGYKEDVPLGVVEINNFMTLYDLRVVIKYELDKKVRRLGARGRLPRVRACVRSPPPALSFAPRARWCRARSASCTRARRARPGRSPCARRGSASRAAPSTCRAPTCPSPPTPPAAPPETPSPQSSPAKPPPRKRPKNVPRF